MVQPQVVVEVDKLSVFVVLGEGKERKTRNEEAPRLLLNDSSEFIRSELRGCKGKEPVVGEMSRKYVTSSPLLLLLQTVN